MSEERAWNEAKEQMGEVIRFVPEPKNAEDKSIFLGEVVQGIYKRMKSHIGRNDSNIYELQLGDGRLVSVWGSQLLDGKFAQIPEGSEVRISYLGIQQPKTPAGRAYAGYKVEWAKPVTTMSEVQTPQPGSSPAPGPVTGGPAAAPITQEGY